MDSIEILSQIRKIVRAINLESKKIYKEYGVSIPQILCLSFLNDSPSCQATQGKIKDFLNLNSSTASGIISRLENKAYVARLPKNGDKRVVTIELTPAGRELLERIPLLLHYQLLENLEKLDESAVTKIEDSLQTLVSFVCKTDSHENDCVDF
jgi:DNA-binding MarR family transcriptional regulator